MKRTYFCVLVGLMDFFVIGQYHQSPCPGVFDYQSDGYSVYGLVRLRSNGPVSTVHISVKFTVSTQLSSNYVGRIEPIDSERALQNFNRGEDLVYRIHFPVVSPLPRVTAIIVNGNTLCYGTGDIPGPNLYVTTISLENVLYLKSGSPVNSFDSYEPTKTQDPVLHLVGNFGNNGQVFTFNDIDNRGNDYYPNEMPNYTLSINVQPSVAPSQSRPGPDYTYYFTEQPTLPPRTQRPQPLPPRTQRPQTLPPPPPRPPPPPAAAPEPLPQITRPQTVPETPSRLPMTSPAQVECGVVAGGNEKVPLIFNGQSYSRGDWPWLVAIYRRREGSLTFICAGTLVSERHVITAAHCMQQKSKITTTKDIVVKVGVYDLEDWGDDISVTRTLTSAFIHQSYNASTLENDILVVTLDRKVDFNTYIRPACLWSGSPDLTRIVGASGVVTGWGSSELGPSGQGEPRMVRIPVVSTDTCRASTPEFHKLTSAKTLCAGDRKGSGPCTGDSGGGLYILDNGRWRLRGIISLSLRPKNGDNTCNLNEYIVFTDTAQYLPWIRNIMSQRVYD